MRGLPNAISIFRAAASIPIVLLVAPETALLALALFSIAALTDAVDGALARHLGATSAAGAFLDPLADKVLVLGTLGGLLTYGMVPALPVATILLREVVITGIRAVAAARAVGVPSNVFGKAKAALQGAAVGAQLLAVAWSVPGIPAAADALLWAAAAVTVITGLDVARRAAATGAPADAVRAHAR